MPGSSEYLRQKHQFLNYWGKHYEKTMANKQSKNGKGQWHTQKDVTLNGGESQSLNFET